MTSNSSSPWVAVGGPQSRSSPSSHYQGGFDPEELMRLLRACTPSQDEMTAEYEARAKRDHDRIIEMGGRPTRPVQLQPTWTATYKDGLIYIFDNEGELQRTLSDDIDPINRHWSRESAHFRRELKNWQRFREYQERLQHLERLETELELDNTDAGLIKDLTRLSDWEEFETFQDLVRVDALNFEDRCRQDFLQITKWEITAEHQPTSSVAHDAIGSWLRVFDQSQKEIEDAKNQLNWIKSQWPKVVAESVDSISKTPELQPALEAKFREQTHATFSAIQKLGGRPSHAVTPPDGSMDDLRRILHWSSEASKYREELLDWKMFLKWQRHSLGDKPAMQRREHRCPQFQSALDFSVEFEKFRRFQYKHALTWLKCWQRVVRWYEEETETPDPDVTPVYLGDYEEAARSHMRDSEQKLAEAASRLEKSRQEHTHSLSEHGLPTGGETRIECPQKPFPPTRPFSGSESSQSSRSSSSSLQFSLSSPSPPSSQSSQSPPSPQSPERLSKNRRPSNKNSSTGKDHRRSKKKNTRKGGAKMRDTNTNTQQQALPTFSLDLHQVEEDNDIQMIDVSEDSRPDEAIGGFEKTESEDTIMTDFEDPLNHTPSCLPESHSKPTANTKFKKLPSPNAQGPTSRKTRSATKLDHALSGRIPKNIGKKPAKKAKEFTEQQAMTLLNAVSINGSPTDSPPLRRSERLKEKAAAPAVISPPQLDAIQISQSSGQKQSQKKPSPVEHSRPSRQKKPAAQSLQSSGQEQSQKEPSPVEPFRPSRQKKPKIQSNAIQPSRSSRQKKLETQVRDLARPG